MLKQIEPPPEWREWAEACERDFRGVLLDGRWVPIEECIEKAGLNKAIPKQRLAAGWMRHEAYTFPRRKAPTRRRGIKQNPYRGRAGAPHALITILPGGRRVSLKQLAHESGIPYRTLHGRYLAGVRGEALLDPRKAGRPVAFAEAPPEKVVPLNLPKSLQLPEPKKRSG